MVDRGFTLIELMIVLGIIAIGASIGGLSIRSILPDIRLSAAARGLKTDMNMARLRAVRENRPVLVVFQPGGKGYDIRLDTKANDKPDDEDLVIKRVFLPVGIEVSSASFSFGRAFAKFDSRGLAPGSAGRAVFENVNRRKQEVIVALTGRVRINRP